MRDRGGWRSEVLAGLLVGFLFALALRFLLVLPLWSYYIASPTAQEQCDQIPVGASRSEVLSTIAGSTPPEELLTIDGRIQVSRRDRMCVIEFDASNSRVASKVVGGR